MFLCHQVFPYGVGPRGLNIEEDSVSKIRRNAMLVGIITLLVLLGKISPSDKETVAGIEFTITKLELCWFMILLWLYQCYRWYGVMRELPLTQPYKKLFDSGCQAEMEKVILNAIKTGVNHQYKNIISRVSIDEIVSNQNVLIKYTPVIQHIGGKPEAMNQETQTMNKSDWVAFTENKRRWMIWHTTAASEYILPILVLLLPVFGIVYRLFILGLSLFPGKGP